MTRKVLCILIANLFPAAALAQSAGLALTGTVGVGGIHTDDGDARDAAKLNEYRDLESGLLTGFDIRGRSQKYWFDLFGENLARDDQYIALRGGSYDVFRYRIQTDALKHNFVFNGLTPYAGAGSALQTATFPRLDPSTWNSVDVGFKRRDDGLMFELQSVNPWYVRVEANQVSTKGSQPGGAPLSHSGIGFVDLATPVDYKTRNLSVEGGYNTRAMHFDLSWMVSKFENAQESLSWTNGYLGNALDTSYLAADNRYTRLAGNASIRDLPLRTTVAARFTVDELKNSVALAGAILSGTGGQTTPTGPTAGSFDGRIKGQTLGITANSAPVKGVDTRLFYNYRKRDDESPNTGFSSSALGTYTALPFSYEKNHIGFDAWWRINSANRLGGGYDYLDTDRVGREDYDRTKDKRLFLEYRNTMVDELAARLKYTRLERDSNFLQANSGSGSTDFLYANRYERKYDLADVEQDQWKLFLDYSPMPDLDLSFEGTIKKNKYGDNVLGRLRDERREVYAGASYSTAGGIRFTIFGDNEEVKYDSQHRSVSGYSDAGAYDPATAPTASNYNWSGKITDKSWAAGVAIDWAATDRLVVKVSAIYYKTDGFVDLSLQQGVPSSVVPPASIPVSDDTRRTSFTVKADYAISKSWSFTGGYAYERYEFADAQYDGYRYTIPQASNADSYLNGAYAFPQHKANIIYGIVTYRF